MKQVAVTSPEPPLEALGRFSQVKVVEAVVEVPSNCSIIYPNFSGKMDMIHDIIYLLTFSYISVDHVFPFELTTPIFLGGSIYSSPPKKDALGAGHY